METTLIPLGEVFPLTERQWDGTIYWNSFREVERPGDKGIDPLPYLLESDTRSLYFLPNRSQCRDFPGNIH